MVCPPQQCSGLRPSCPGHVGLRPYAVTHWSDGSLHFSTEEEAEYKRAWCDAYARRLKWQTGEWVQRSQMDGRCKTIQSDLEKSTHRLSEPHVANMVAQEIVLMEQQMRPGQKAPHLQEMARRLSIRGTDLHIFKSKCTQHASFGPLLEAEMSKKCVAFWREAIFQVKMAKTPHVRTTF